MLTSLFKENERGLVLPASPETSTFKIVVMKTETSPPELLAKGTNHLRLIALDPAQAIHQFAPQRLVIKLRRLRSLNHKTRKLHEFNRSEQSSFK